MRIEEYFEKNHFIYDLYDLEIEFMKANIYYENFMNKKTQYNLAQLTDTNSYKELNDNTLRFTNL